MRIIFVAVLLFFCYCKGELHSFSIKYKTRITSNETVITTVAVPSSVACARECNRDDCCTACYNKTANTCHLHRNCFPVIEHSESGVLLRKNDVILSNQDTTVQTGIKTTSDKTTRDKTTTNITYYTMATDKTSSQPGSGITTDYMKITDTKARTTAKISDLTIYETTNLTSTTVNTGIKTTSDNLTSDKTTTTDMMYYKTTTNKTSYQTNNTTTYIKITDTKASTAAKTSDFTSYETTKLKTTTMKATPVQTTNDIIDCTGVASGSTSGVYTIYIENQPVDVYCEMTGGEQWTV
ncbi:TN [Mytilus edulis]|uniref:TN n=1 Tax=Mytilus edulis TaxID=6550 RepID=A0A8S3QQZ4_MYTED|nr:TN [Mytilus edulis]